MVLNGEWVVNQFALAPNLSQIATAVEDSVLDYLQTELAGGDNVDDALDAVMQELGQSVVNQVSLIKSTIKFCTMSPLTSRPVLGP